MAMPTSARFSAGASLTPSPGHRHHFAVRLDGLHQRSLCSGLTRANTSQSRTRRSQRVVVQFVDLLAGQDASAVADAEVAGRWLGPSARGRR
jgi:hypothetical protein